MTTNELDDAIMAHVGWIGRFENSLKGLDREPFDCAAIGDDERCAFGRWLAANPTRIEPSRHARIRALHRAFHEEAMAIAAMIRTRPAADVVVAKHLRFDVLSEELIGALFDAKVESARLPTPR